MAASAGCRGVRETDPSKVVLGADVLGAAAGDAGADRDARATLSMVEGHDGVTLVASDALLDAAVTVAAEHAGDPAAAALRDRVDATRLAVAHPSDDHPALASAYRAKAAHLVTRDPDLLGADAAAVLGPLRVSVRTPEAFLQVFDPDALPGERDNDGG